LSHKSPSRSWLHPILLGLVLVLASAEAPAQPVPPEEDAKTLGAKAGALGRKALALVGEGKAAQGVPLAQEALAINRRLYPPARYPDGHANLAVSLKNLGVVLQHLGSLTAAEPCYREALAMCRKLYPPERFPKGHPLLATCLLDIGLSLKTLGDLTAAEPHLRQAPDMYRRLYPAERNPQGHPELALSLENLGLVLLARGEVAGGEGVFGLQRAFHIAGARQVVASLWQVDDEATAALMGLFYHHLWQEGRSPLEALRQAPLALYHHPEQIGALARAPARLWAGFVLSGAGRQGE
jgi:tetratricopeptide (TPR) repeat protein